MNDLTYDAIYERERQELTANQPRYYEMVRQSLLQGMALVVKGANGQDLWLACAPSSRLEPHLFLAQDLAVPGEAGLHRIEFEEIHFIRSPEEGLGWLMVKGWSVAEFRPIVDTEDEELVRAWNEHSGRDPLPMPPPRPPRP